EVVVVQQDTPHAGRVHPLVALDITQQVLVQLRLGHGSILTCLRSPLRVAGAKAPALRIPALQAPALRIPTLQAPALQIPALQVPALQVPALQVPALQVPAPRLSAHRACESPP